MPKFGHTFCPLFPRKGPAARYGVGLCKKEPRSTFRLGFCAQRVSIGISRAAIKNRPEINSRAVFVCFCILRYGSMEATLESAGSSTMEAPSSTRVSSQPHLATSKTL